jgi:hypothetical protein
LSSPQWTDVLTAFGTVGATVVALALALRLGEVLRKPRLTVTAHPGPPDCQVIEEEIETRTMSGFGPPTPGPVLRGVAFYSRLRIDNEGRRRARNVEVRMTRLWRKENDAFVEDTDFLAMNLKWAHREATSDPLTVPVIDRHLPRHCGFLRFSKPWNNDLANSWIQFDTEVQPLQIGLGRWPTRKKPGTYKAEIAMTADNCKMARSVLLIEFAGTWLDDPAGLAEQGLKVTVI